jgi:hypothetical protein
MKNLTFYERLERLDSWARQRNLITPNETLRKEALIELFRHRPPVLSVGLKFFYG